MDSVLTRRGIILFAHGSRDPLWRKPMEAVAQRVHLLDPLVLVECAFLEMMAPDLPSCAAGMVQAGVEAVTVVPMFLGVGTHAREDLPRLIEALHRSHPQTKFTLLPAIGENTRVVELLADIALDRH